jgi:hypothetical protein
MSDTATDSVDAIALDHAWHWFEYHANQRMTMIRFYLIVAGAIASGAGYLWVSGEFLLSGVLSVFGMISSFCFMRLDKRVSSLVQIGENALKHQQNIFANTLDEPAFKICQLAGELRTATGDRLYLYPYTYGENFRVLFLLAAVVFWFVLFLNLRMLVG